MVASSNVSNDKLQQIVMFILMRKIWQYVYRIEQYKVFNINKYFRVKSREEKVGKTWVMYKNINRG